MGILNGEQVMTTRLYVGADATATPRSFSVNMTELEGLPRPLLVYPINRSAELTDWLKDRGVPVVGAESWSIILRSLKEESRFFLRDRIGEIESIPYGMYSEIVLFETLDEWRTATRRFSDKVARFAEEVRALNPDEVKLADEPDSNAAKARKLISEVIDYTKRARGDYATDFWLKWYIGQLPGMRSKYRRACRLLGR